MTPDVPSFQKLQTEFAAQNIDLSRIKEALEEFSPGVSLAIPSAWFEQFSGETAAVSHQSPFAIPNGGMRG